MMHGQNGGARKRKKQKKRKLNETRGKFLIFAEIRWIIYKFCGNDRGNMQYV